MDEQEIECPHCDLIFCVIWRNDGGGGPEHCPRCGALFEYHKFVWKPEQSNDGN